MNGTKVIDHYKIAKWLRVVMYTAVFGLANTLVGMLPFVPASVTSWVSSGIMAVLIVSMFQLAPTNERYKKTGVYRTVILVLTVVTELLHLGSVLTLAVSILSIVAMYQEYHAHSELIAEKNRQLSGKWTSLFIWNILSGLIVGFASTAAVMFIALTDMDVMTATAMVVAILGIPQYIIEILYILYLKKMVVLFVDDEVR